jgi:queuine tRNA-ribosyltransferase
VEEMEALEVPLILGNTYHLALRPTTELLDDCGGLHKFMGWRRAMLTDSGGFQMVSLLKLANITEEGVTFQSPSDGSKMLLTPEKSMQLQNEIGADIMMALDDVVSSTTPSRERVEEAMHRTLRWIDRCISAHSRPTAQNLFGIVQGGLDLDLRAHCCEELIKRDLPGYAIGGLSGGEAKDQFWRVVYHCAMRLPADKPRYCMGVGYPIDLVVCVALGIDMFDCVYPARTARFGVALTDGGNMQLKNKKFKADFSPIEKDCSCATCTSFTRAYLHCLVCKEQTGARLVTIHNIAYMMRLGKRMRQAIRDDVFPEFVLGFFQKWYPRGDWPQWCYDALAQVNINLPHPPVVVAKEAAASPNAAPPASRDEQAATASRVESASEADGIGGSGPGKERGMEGGMSKRASKRGEKKAERAEKKRQRAEGLVRSGTLP